MQSDSMYILPAGGAVTGYLLGQSAVYAALGAAAGYAAWAVSDRGVSAASASGTTKPDYLTPVDHPVSIPPVTVPQAKHAVGASMPSHDTSKEPINASNWKKYMAADDKWMGSGINSLINQYLHSRAPGHPKAKHTLEDEML